MDYVKRILGEQEDISEPLAPAAPAPALPVPGEEEPEPVEAEINELASLWTHGNQKEVAERFMGMDNETAVKLVFAIGMEGALALAIMADEMLESVGDEGEPSAIDDAPFGDTQAVPPGQEQDDAVQRIIGQAAEVP